MEMAGIGKRTAGCYTRVKAWLMEYAYLVTLASVIAVIVGAALYTDHVKAQQQAVSQAAADAMEIAAAQSTAPQVTPLPTIAPLVASRTFVPKIVTVRPVSGKIIRAYEKEPIVWGALGAVQAHEAIDIVGAEDESVLSAMDGVVKEMAMDALWGWSVVIEHTDGSEGTYAGLKTIVVRAGQGVSRGQEIGTLMADIPCEAELSTHLHFELKKNGVMQDPEGILPE